MLSYVDIGGDLVRYSGVLPEGTYQWPLSISQQNDPEFLDYAQEIKKICVSYDIDEFEVIRCGVR